MLRAAVVASLVVGLALPATAHGREELEAWSEDWIERVQRRGMSEELARERVDVLSRHRWFWAPPEKEAPTRRASVSQQGSDTRSSKPSVYRGMGNGTSDVERYRDLVGAHFGVEVELALCVMRYESGGNPNALNPSGAAGLYQVMPFWWDHFGGDRWDPATNVRVAKRIRDLQGWTAWMAYNRGKC